MLKLVYNPNNNSIVVYGGYNFEKTVISIYSGATYAASENGNTYIISTVTGSTITEAFILPLSNTYIEIQPLITIE